MTWVVKSACADTHAKPGPRRWPPASDASSVDPRSTNNTNSSRHRSTIWKVLHRHGVSRQRRSERSQSSRRYEWSQAGALLHIDAFELPKFDRPGHSGARRSL